MPLTYQETDTPSGCAPAAFCSPNGLGAGSGIAGRFADVQGVAPGTKAVTMTLNATETGKVYALLEVSPTVGAGAVRNWFATRCIFGFRVPAPGNPNIDWVRTDVCHLNAQCASLELLGSDTNAVNLGPSDPDFVYKTILLAAAVVPVAAGDKVGILLSFTNNAAGGQSVAWVPDQTVTFDSWQPDRGFEMVLGRKRPKAYRHAALVALLADDDLL